MILIGIAGGRSAVNEVMLVNRSSVPPIIVSIQPHVLQIIAVREMRIVHSVDD